MTLPVGVKSVSSVVLMRRTALTHDVDGDQRSIVLPFKETAGALTVTLTGNAAVVPPGDYMLFVNTAGAGGLVPSVSAPIQVTGADTVCH